MNIRQAGAGPADRAPERVAGRRARRAALAAAATALLVLVVADLVLADRRVAQARAEVRDRMAPYANALSNAVERRIGLLSGFKSFIESRPTPASLDEEFALFAQGSLIGASGVMAIQYVRDGRIAAIWPYEGNEEAIGYDFTADPRRAVREDYARSLNARRVTVTGPVPLVEGGSGILLRERLADRPGFPQLAAIVLDVTALTAETGIPEVHSGLRLELRNRDLRWFGGDPAESAAAPETLRVAVEDGSWYLLGAPAAGWTSLTAPGVWGFRLAALLMVAVAGLVGYVVGGREDRWQREVQTSELRLELALRAGGMGVFELDVATRRLRWTEAATALFGFDAAAAPDAVERAFARLHPEDRQALEQLVEETAAGHRDHYVHEYRLLRADGRTRRVLTIGQLERDPEGRPRRIFGIIWDDTERHELEEQLRHAQRIESVGKLAGGVAHDFNNLLTALGGFIELARDRAGEVRDDEAARTIREDLEQAMQIAQRGAAVTGQLLAFSRRGRLAARAVDLGAAVHEVEPMLGRLLGGLVVLRTEVEAGLPPAWIDPGQLTQVVMNLSVNARDAMPKGGTLRVRVRGVAAGGARPEDAPPGDWVLLEVEDEGLGMTPEVQARLFEPYFTTKEIGKGTGLGLAVVYGAVQSAGGVVAVRSAPGQGTRFRVYLPPHRGSEPPGGTATGVANGRAEPVAIG